MPDVEEILMNKACTFFKEDIELPKSIEQLALLPCYTLKEISEVDGGKLKSIMNINIIKELAEVELEQKRKFIKQNGWKISIFEQWVLAARVISRISKFDISGAKKLALIGLENAGKTAIRELVLRKYKGNLLLYDKVIRKLQPTKGVEREEFSVLDDKLQLWDMGGQEIYRNNYLKEPERYLLDINVVIYVIDVQDKSRHNKSIEYLKKLASTFRSVNEHPYFVVCYHKFDPDISQRQKYHDWIENSWKIIALVLDENDLKYKRFITSIYDDITLFNVFSQALKIASDFNVCKIINTILENHAKTEGFDNLILLSNNGMKLGEYIKNGISDEEVLEQAYQFAVHTLNSVNQLNEINKLMTKKKYIKNIFYSFYAGDTNFMMTRVLLLDRSIYLASFQPKKKEFDVKFTQTLKPWLSNLFI